MYTRRRSVRYFLRTDVPSIAFSPFGLIGLLLILVPLLYGVFYFAKQTIEAPLQLLINKELAAQGLEWVNVEADGQNVHLSGIGPVKEGERALQIAQQAHGDTWYGLLQAPISVTGDFGPQTPLPSQFMVSVTAEGVLTLTGLVRDQAAKASLLEIAKQSVTTTAIIRVVDQLRVTNAAMMPGSLSLAKRALTTLITCDEGHASANDGVFALSCYAAQDKVKRITTAANASLAQGRLGQITVKAKAVTAIEPPVWADFRATIANDGTLTLKGFVSDQAEKALLLKTAGYSLQTGHTTRVIDAIEVTNKPMVQGSLNLANRALKTVIRCDEGYSDVTQGVLSLVCQAPHDEAHNITASTKVPFTEGRLGQVTISLVNACNKAFANTLQAKAITFASGSAQLNPSSNVLLDDITAVAKRCPGIIRVEGHTDDTGSFESNMTLSGARANAVVVALVKRGIENKRLVAKGYGSTAPRANGSTQQARALNRRIEFRVLGTGEK